MLSVHKFGGSALSSAQSIVRAADIVASRRDAAMVVVVSALSGVTDALLQLGHRAASGSGDLHEGVAALRQRHVDAASDCMSATRFAATHAHVCLAFDHLLISLQSVRKLRRLTPKDEASIASVGEQVAAELVASSIEARGCKAVVVDASRVMTGFGPFNDATPDHDRIRPRAYHTLQPLIAAGSVPVVPGFYGVNREGDVVTFGRGGSDLTAACLGRALHAREVVLWKDVPGLMTADPRIVGNARPLRRVSLLEAAELSRLGAKVLHPGAIDALGEACRLRIRAFADQKEAGTSIRPIHARTSPMVKAVTATERAGVATIGLIGERSGNDDVIAGHALATLSERDIEVLTMSSGPHGHSLSLGVDSMRSAEAQRALHDSFHLHVSDAAARRTPTTSLAHRAVR